MKLKDNIHSPVDFIPREYPLITSKYGKRVLVGKENFHDGLDFANPLHDCKDRLNPIDTNVYAIASGVICFDFDRYQDEERFKTKQDSAGNMVIIKTMIDSVEYYVRYLHLIENYVKENQFIEAGQLIGRYADVGFSYGPHLHLDIYTHDWSQKLDPTPIMFDI